jgi:hypothetical protein
MSKSALKPDANALHILAHDEFPQNQTGFDCFSEADIIGDEEVQRFGVTYHLTGPREQKAVNRVSLNSHGIRHRCAQAFPRGRFARREMYDQGHP